MSQPHFEHRLVFTGRPTLGQLLTELETLAAVAEDESLPVRVQQTFQVGGEPVITFSVKDNGE